MANDTRYLVKLNFFLPVHHFLCSDFIMASVAALGLSKTTVSRNFLTFFAIYTIPNWQELVSQDIYRAKTSPTSHILLSGSEKRQAVSSN